MNGARLIIDPKQAHAQDVAQNTAQHIAQQTGHAVIVLLVSRAGEVCMVPAGLSAQAAMHVMASTVAQALQPASPSAPTQPAPKGDPRA